MSSTKWMIFNMIYLLSLIIFVSNSVEFLEGRRLLLSKIPPIDVTILEDSLALAPSIPQKNDVDDHDDGSVLTYVSISTHDDHDDDNHDDDDHDDDNDDDHNDDNQDDDTVLTPASSPTHDDHNDDNQDDDTVLTPASSPTHDDHNDDNQDDDTVLTPTSSPTHDDHNDDDHND
ncbi:hypothetical protein KY290_014140 [Solanum tuberosum]|uniref:Uncharacterized protein n=1 Tax=Solanum tuberosum TaxID=4113 RepID=A0ABQ7VQY9_SOLTU|nr:hypothetical protein KY289_014225 [Solanum tuberosum]KAH0699305.1 hypothetical protein KY284_013520 [Solanum tuberosum]KAH0717554.1 hypothetical protein KY285_013585 [Solanum tuberosum]KAH0770159.1 hypothetical protein KY290_014140 [Solanum tuberosum]